MLIDYDEIYTLYIVKKYTMAQTAKKLGIGVGSVHRLIKKLGIKSRKLGIDYVVWNKNKNYTTDSRILAKKKHPRYIHGKYIDIDFYLLKECLLPDLCIECRKPATLIHHIDNNHSNNVLENLIPMCNRCHTSLHNKIRDSYKHLLKVR